MVGICWVTMMIMLMMIMLKMITIAYLPTQLTPVFLLKILLKAWKLKDDNININKKFIYCPPQPPRQIPCLFHRIGVPTRCNRSPLKQGAILQHALLNVLQRFCFQILIPDIFGHLPNRRPRLVSLRLIPKEIGSNSYFHNFFISLYVFGHFLNIPEHSHQ